MIKLWSVFKKQPLTTIWRLLNMPFVVVVMILLFLVVSSFNLSFKLGAEAVKELF